LDAVISDELPVFFRREGYTGWRDFLTGSSFDYAIMAERAKEMIEKRLRLVLFVSAQGLREADKFNEGGFQLLSHVSMLTKSVATDKLRSAPPGGRALPRPWKFLLWFLPGDVEIGWKKRPRACNAARHV
jgi:hypothetical protein